MIILAVTYLNKPIQMEAKNLSNKRKSVDSHAASDKKKSQTSATQGNI